MAQDGKLSRRVLCFLVAGEATIEPAAAGAQLILRNGKGAISATVTILQKLASAGAVLRTGDRITLTSAGRTALRRAAAPADAFQAQHRQTLASSVEAAGVHTTVEINQAESPLALLMRRKDKQGRPFLSRAQFEAGERLRGDYTRGSIMPRLGANWEAGVSRGRRGAGSAGDLTDAALAARQRVDRAVTAVGPEVSGLLVDVCCFLKGLETVERERNWPARSAKIVLGTALAALARHYRPPSTLPRAHGMHWGSEDYRPSIA